MKSIQYYTEEFLRYVIGKIPAYKGKLIETKEGLYNLLHEYLYKEETFPKLFEGLFTNKDFKNMAILVPAVFQEEKVITEMKKAELFSLEHWKAPKFFTHKELVFFKHTMDLLTCFLETDEVNVYYYHFYGGEGKHRFYAKLEGMEEIVGVSFLMNLSFLKNWIRGNRDEYKQRITREEPRKIKIGGAYFEFDADTIDDWDEYHKGGGSYRIVKGVDRKQKGGWSILGPFIKARKLERIEVFLREGDLILDASKQRGREKIIYLFKVIAGETKTELLAKTNTYEALWDTIEQQLPQPSEEERIFHEYLLDLFTIEEHTGNWEDFILLLTILHNDRTYPIVQYGQNFTTHILQMYEHYFNRVFIGVYLEYKERLENFFTHELKRIILERHAYHRFDYKTAFAQLERILTEFREELEEYEGNYDDTATWTEVLDLVNQCYIIYRDYVISELKKANEKTMKERGRPLPSFEEVEEIEKEAKHMPLEKLLGRMNVKQEDEQRLLSLLNDFDEVWLRHRYTVPKTYTVGGVVTDSITFHTLDIVTYTYYHPEGEKE